MKIFETVHRVVFGSYLFDIAKVVSKRRFAEEFINTGESFFRPSGQVVKVHKVHSVAKAADQRVADAVVSEANGLVALKPHFAPSLNSLKLEIVSGFLGGLRGLGGDAPKFFKARQDIAHIADGHQHFGFMAENRLRHFQKREPTAAFVKNHGRVNVGIIAFQDTPHHAEFRRFVRRRLEFKVIVPSVSDAENYVHDAGSAGDIKFRILRQDITKKRGTASRQTGDEVVSFYFQFVRFQNAGILASWFFRSFHSRHASILH